MAVAKQRAKRWDASKEGYVYKCFCCGKEASEPKGTFFISPASELWTFNNRYIPYCTECINRMYDEYKESLKSGELACYIICHILDLPFSLSLYKSLEDKGSFSVGTYLRTCHASQFKGQTFVKTILDKQVQNDKNVNDAREENWTSAEKKNRDDIIRIVGYDPFEGYKIEDRRYLFGELIKYFDDDTGDDTYKLSQVIQIVNNNNQIRQYDLLIAHLDPIEQSQSIQELNSLKKDLVSSNDRIAKENEISVKNRSNKQVGRGTLTYLMRDMREKGFSEIAANYYNQLRSEGTQWAADMSIKAMMQNTMFDENDKQEIFEYQRQKLMELQKEVDDLKEENRLLKVRQGDNL